MATGHAALGHAGHLVATVHGVPGSGGRLRVMMPVNRTLAARGATGAGVEKPGGSAQRRVKQDDRNEAERCEKRAPAVLVLSSHLRPKLLKSYANSALITLNRANCTDIPCREKELQAGGR